MGAAMEKGTCPGEEMHEEGANPGHAAAAQFTESMLFTLAN